MRGPNPKESRPLTLTLSPEYKGEGTRKLLNPVPYIPDPFVLALTPLNLLVGERDLQLGRHLRKTSISSADSKRT